MNLSDEGSCFHPIRGCVEGALEVGFGALFVSLAQLAFTDPDQQSRVLRTKDEGPFQHPRRIGIPATVQIQARKLVVGDDLLRFVHIR